MVRVKFRALGVKWKTRIPLQSIPFAQVRRMLLLPVAAVTFITQTQILRRHETRCGNLETLLRWATAVRYCTDSSQFDLCTRLFCSSSFDTTAAAATSNRNEDAAVPTQCIYTHANTMHVYAQTADNIDDRSIVTEMLTSCRDDDDDKLSGTPFRWCVLCRFTCTESRVA